MVGRKTPAGKNHASAQSLQTRSGRCIKQNSDYIQKCAQKRERQNLIYQIKKALEKDEAERNQDEVDLLKNCKDLVRHVDVCKQNRLTQAAHQEIIVDDEAVLREKCAQLAKAINESKSCVVYTGAGISTSASIPDYRGPNGLWTMIEKGIQIRPPDFSQVEPTYSHMALKELVRLDLVKHIVSQNCDGLHLRSGIDRTKLSELHGNCFIEFCPECYDEYVRLFDVTEKSIFRKHATGRYCPTCVRSSSSNSSTNDDQGETRVQLRDSIIHFGEKLRNGYPYNWEGARENVRKADVIICLGSSLKVLKHYACLWPKKQSVSLYIVNIQWTPKDKQARLKINGYCDQVMKLIVDHLKAHHKSLNVIPYSIKNDPLPKMATELDSSELNTTTKSFLNKSSPRRQSSHSSPASHKAKSAGDQPSSVSPQTNGNTLNSWFTKSFKNRKKSAQKATSNQNGTTDA